jgi:hypothetical protein
MVKLLTLSRVFSGGQTRESYQRHFARCGESRYISLMATTKTKFRCMQCEMSEERCECEKCCALCQSQIDIRLCQDGLYYCPPCRQACDYKVSD